jgi:hypothetical protein
LHPRIRFCSDSSELASVFVSIISLQFSVLISHPSFLLLPPCTTSPQSISVPSPLSFYLWLMFLIQASLQVFKSWWNMSVPADKTASCLSIWTWRMAINSSNHRKDSVCAGRTNC